MIPFKQRDLVRDKVFDSDLLPCINKPITRIYPQHWFDNSIAEFLNIEGQRILNLHFIIGLVLNTQSIPICSYETPCNSQRYVTRERFRSSSTQAQDRPLNGKES